MCNTVPVLPFENTVSTKGSDSAQWIGLALPIDGNPELLSAETSGTAVLEEAEPISNGNSETTNHEFQEMEINNEEEETNMDQNEQNERAAAGENRVAALKIEAVLSLLGLPATATLDEVKMRVEGKPLEESRSNAASEVIPNESVRADWTAMETRMQKLEERLINSVVDQAIREGRTTPAQRRYWSAQLAEDFDGKSVELANAVQVLKTDRRADDFKGEAERHSERASASSEVLRLVKVKMDSGLDYDRAWCAVKEENQNLFTLMQQPEKE